MPSDPGFGTSGIAAGTATDFYRTATSGPMARATAFGQPADVDVDGSVLRPAKHVFRHCVITWRTEMKVLMVLTSHDTLGDTGRKTGFWLEELAAPYYTFKDAGAEIVLASPLGGQPPLDPKSNEPAFQTDHTRRFESDPDAQSQLAATVRLDSVSESDFDTVFYPGGHGPMWDLAEDEDSVALIESFLGTGKPIALVCHAPGVLRHVRTPDDRPLVEGRQVTGFANTEEAAVGLTEVVPFLVEDELQAKGGLYSKAGDWAPHVVRDGLLITGQNPASSAPAAAALLEQLAARANR